MIGTEILNYRITSLVGSGGMGTVYVAEHKYITQQKVAIKVINADMVNDYTRERLKQEAEHLAALNHPNIVKLINYHIDEKGNIYLIMEYAEGVSLEKFINEVNGLVVEDRICGIFEPILDAFGYAHSKGILHRDIKPSNIMISEEGVPKVLDFGIATIMGKQEDGVIAGTPSYMSPEQVQGQTLDSRSDIYSLGVLLHQMLTGNAPYDTTTMSEHEISQKVVNDPLPPLRSFYKYISDKTQKVVDKATAKNPDDRFKDCSDFKNNLHKAIYPPKIPRWVWGSVAAVIVLALGAGLWWWDYTRTKVNYYRDYTEVWGEPVGIGRLSSSQQKHTGASYRIESSRGKVRRLTRVNSQGKTIPDTESEHVDRPTDATYFYTPAGKVSRVKVMDQNGRVEYVKVYNENLKTIVFQFDDEHGTEKTLGNHTIGSADAFGNQSDSGKGAISRWHLTYDDNGYVERVDYAGLYNARVSDADGIYGRQYKRDDKGRIVEETYINLDGSPQSTPWGLGIKTFEYDKNDNWVRAVYYTLDREPATDAEGGTEAYEIVYDDNANAVKFIHQHHDRSLMLPKKYGVAEINREFDENGNITSTSFMGIDRQPTLYGGYHLRKTEYDQNGFVTAEHYLDENGNPVLIPGNYSSIKASCDDAGNLLEMSYYGLDSEPVYSAQNMHKIVNRYDSLGNRISQLYYAPDGSLSADSDKGIAGELNEYDSNSNLIKTIYLNTDSVITPGNYGVAVATYSYDPRGNLTRLDFWEDAECTTHKPAFVGIAGREFEYDQNGNRTISRSFDVDGKPAADETGVAEARNVYNEQNQLVEYTYYGINGKPCRDRSGEAGARFKRDSRGNATEIVILDTDHNPDPKSNIVRLKHDDRNNMIERAYFTSTGAPTNGGADFVHREVFTYDDRNNQTSETTFDANGKPMAVKGTKIVKALMEYDKVGNNVKTSYYDESGNLANNTGGVAMVTNEYDNQGNAVHTLYFNANGKPTDLSVCIPELKMEYDRAGNLTYLAAMDGSGKLIMAPSMGASIRRDVYDGQNRQIERAYFDTLDKPILSSTDGFHKHTAKYGPSNVITEEAFYGADGKPMLYLGRYHKRVVKTDKFNRVESEVSYGIDGKEHIPADMGFSRAVYTYKEDTPISEVDRVLCYTPDGKLVATFRYSAERGFELVSSNAPDNQSNQAGQNRNNSDGSSNGKNNWRTMAQEMASECPYSLGRDLNYLEITSIQIGNNHVSMNFTAQESQYEMTEEMIEKYKSAARYVADTYLQSVSPRPRVTITLKDLRGRTIYTKNY